MVATEQQIYRLRSPGRGRHNHPHHRPGRTTACPVLIAQRGGPFAWDGRRAAGFRRAPACAHVRESRLHNFTIAGQDWPCRAVIPVPTGPKVLAVLVFLASDLLTWPAEDARHAGPDAGSPGGPGRAALPRTGPGPESGHRVMTMAEGDGLMLAQPGREPYAGVSETHSAVVYFAGDRAFKLKKPVSLGFLDFSTAEARAAACQREVELNRRFAPDVYLGVVQVRDPAGRVCDHLVVMRRAAGRPAAFCPGPGGRSRRRRDPPGRADTRRPACVGAARRRDQRAGQPGRAVAPVGRQHRPDPVPAGQPARGVMRR